MNKSKPHSLGDYINKHFGGSQKHFADAQEVLPPQVTQWLDKEFIVFNDVMYSPRRELKKILANRLTPSKCGQKN